MYNKVVPTEGLKFLIPLAEWGCVIVIYPLRRNNSHHYSSGAVKIAFIPRGENDSYYYSSRTVYQLFSFEENDSYHCTIQTMGVLSDLTTCFR
jgi:hypothetical protein